MKTYSSNRELSPAWPIGWSFFFAIFGGFGLAGHLSFVSAFGYNLGPDLTSLVQAHGHLQLFGWLGFLLIGISLHLLPRLFSRNLPSGTRLVLCLLVTGILVRAVAQILLPYMRDQDHYAVIQKSFLTATTLETVGIFVYVSIIVRLLVSRVETIAHSPDIARFLPYILCIVIGWILCGILNLVGSVSVIRQGLHSIPHSINLALIDSFLYLTLLPTTLLFSIKLLPLFLGLREPRWKVSLIGWGYTIAALFHLSGGLLSEVSTGLGGRIFYLPKAVMGFLLLIFIWNLDVLTRRHTPERLSKLKITNGLRGRGMLPDHGEYGRFELHLVAAYAWLLIACILQIASIFPISIGVDTTRHILAFGFASNLVFGVAYRLFPGLFRWKLYSRKAVSITFIGLNLAVAGRLAPGIVSIILDPSPAFSLAIRWGFGLSGPIALLMVILLAVNITLSFAASRPAAPRNLGIQSEGTCHAS